MYIIFVAVKKGQGSIGHRGLRSFINIKWKIISPSVFRQFFFLGKCVNKESIKYVITCGQIKSEQM